MKNKDMSSLLLTEVSRRISRRIFGISVIFAAFHSTAVAEDGAQSVGVLNPVLLGIAVLFVAFTIIFWRWSLDKEVAKRTARLNEELLQREKSEQALVTSQQRYATLFNAAGDAIFLIDGEKVVDCNNAAAEMFVSSQLSMINGSLFEWSASYQPDGFDSKDKGKDLLSAAVNGEVQMFDWVYQRTDGTEFDAEVSLTRCDTEGHNYVVAIVRDISERKRIDKLKDEFISTVSHEIRTPLTSILGSMKLVLSGELKGGLDQATPMLNIAHNNAERLLSLVNDLLDIQKLASKHSQLTYEETNIAEFLQQAVINNQAYADQHNVTLVLEDVPDCYTALVDQGRLLQVMNNLLSNAAKFSPDGSNVEIRTEELGFMLRVNVVDHGVGIPEEFHGQVFERFTQADSTDTRKVGGTGLGLNIAQAIVEQHGGQLNFTSKAGEGSTFYFDIPFESNQEQSKAS